MFPHSKIFDRREAQSTTKFHPSLIPTSVGLKYLSSHLTAAPLHIVADQPETKDEMSLTSSMHAYLSRCVQVAMCDARHRHPQHRRGKDSVAVEVLFEVGEGFKLSPKRLLGLCDLSDNVRADVVPARRSQHRIWILLSWESSRGNPYPARQVRNGIALSFFAVER